MKKNITKLKDCYGCGVCVISCPKKIINLELNKDGFYSPVIHEQDKCIECGLCLEVCAYNHSEIANPINHEKIKAYGCWSKDPYVRKNCTTGGLGYEIAHEAIKNGRTACVVKYNITKQEAQHYVASNEQDLIGAIGSKYIPSWTEPGYKNISLKSPNIIFGLPCQIDSFRRLIKIFKVEDNFQLVDLLCHGTPSLLLWRRYLQELEPITGKVLEVKFRSKVNGWHDSACIEVVGENVTLVQPSSKSSFYSLFFTDTCLNKCCHGRCKYKLTSSSADIRIGDYWGKKYAHDNKGVNVLLSFTEEGNRIVNSLKEHCVFEPSSIEEAMDKQMAHNAPNSPYRSFIFYAIRNNVSLTFIKNVVLILLNITKPHKIIKKLLK